MALTDSEKPVFIEEHLYHELRCLLGAVTVWRAFVEGHRGFQVVVAMDSAFVHARCLFNFFTMGKRGNDVSIVEFGVPNHYSSSLYDGWKESLNRHVLHISGGRIDPTNEQGGGHLNEQVEPFAQELLKLWTRFEGESHQFRDNLVKARKRATVDAEKDHERLRPCGINQVSKRD